MEVRLIKEIKGKGGSLTRAEFCTPRGPVVFNIFRGNRVRIGLERGDYITSLSIKPILERMVNS